MLAYTKEYGRYMPAKEELLRQKKESFAYEPLISIVIPLYETPEPYLRELIDSILAQSYKNWEICFADGSKTDGAACVVMEYEKAEKRIRYQKLFKNGGISENTNSGFAMARGDYIALMDHDDLLCANALYEMVKCLNESYSKDERTLAMLYSDEDKINGDGAVHSRPHFKPDFNLEFLRRNNYFCHFLMFSSLLLQKAGGLKKEYDGAQDYDFVLRCVDAGAHVRHVPKILYHWRIHEGSTAGNSADKSYAFDNGCRAIEAHLKRCNEEGTAKVTSGLGVYQVTYALRGVYSVTVAADKEQLLRMRRHYQSISFAEKDYELRIQYLQTDTLYRGIEKDCSGDYILYLKRNIKAEPNGLLEHLLGICQHKKNGVAGVKLLEGKRSVASCGLIYDGDGNLIASCKGLPAVYKGYFLHAVIPQNVSAVSFECVMLRKDAFQKLGGLDDAFRGIYQEADYCFRLAERGYGVVVTPEITAVRRSGIKKTESQADKALFYERWKQKLSRPDPCYNCNLSLKEGSTYAMKQP